MSDDAQQICQAAYQTAYRSMLGLIEEADTADKLLGACWQGMEGLDASMMGANRMVNAEVACGAGCSFCCSLRIDVRAHEVFAMVRSLKANRTDEELESIRRSALDVSDRVSGMTDAERNASSIPCVLLMDGLCSVYDGRPSACRRYFSASVEKCQELKANPGATAEIENPFVQGFGRYVANGVNNAFFRHGFDPYLYDLPSAIFEALEDPMREQRWFAKMKAFSADAESKVPDGFSQREAVEKLLAALPPLEEEGAAE